jgi:hypothetical protein
VPITTRKYEAWSCRCRRRQSRNGSRSRRTSRCVPASDRGHVSHGLSCYLLRALAAQRSTPRLPGWFLLMRSLSFAGWAIYQACWDSFRPERQRDFHARMVDCRTSASSSLTTGIRASPGVCDSLSSQKRGMPQAAPMLNPNPCCVSFVFDSARNSFSFANYAYTRNSQSTGEPGISQVSQETPTATWREGRPWSPRESVPHASDWRLGGPPRAFRAHTA